MSKKIVIAGAGIGGLCAAVALAKRGFEVVVYEQSQQLGEVGAGLQLSPNAVRVLQALDIADKVKAMAFRPKTAVMRHFRTGKTYFTHKRLRSAYRSLNTNMKYLFTWYDNP